MRRKLLCLLAAVLVVTACIAPVSANAEYVSQWTKSEETITYSRVEESYFDFATNTFPYYSVDDSTVRSCCGPVAGANIIGYYDRFYPNMIANYQGYVFTTGNYCYVSPFYISPTISDLAVRIGTDDEGTTYVGFKRGLAAYILAAGYTGGFRDVVSSGVFYYDYFVEYINLGYPVALFMSKQNTIWWSEPAANTRKFEKETSPYAHVMVAFGYRTAKFYRMENGVETLFRSDTYLHVSDGYGFLSYVILDDTVTIDDGFATLIHNT